MYIKVIDNLPPESTAMLSALYSRSNKSVVEHLKIVAARGAAAFIEQYYAKDFHKSIADTSFTTIYVEGVSILAAKVIQDNVLYNGQESSSRYIDFSSQVTIDPSDSVDGKEILNSYINLYSEIKPAITSHLKNEYPLLIGEDSKVWEKAIQARTFDVIRSVLPPGVTTQLSWTTNLRQAYDKLIVLLEHPLEEIRDIAVNIFKHLQEKYPSSFKQDINEERQAYLRDLINDIHYQKPRQFINSPHVTINGLHSIANKARDYKRILNGRPTRTELPKSLDVLGTMDIRLLLDYGSYRDLQRHRGGAGNLPLLTNTLGFNSWYLDQMPIHVRTLVLKTLGEQRIALEALVVNYGLDDYQKQYYIPMGYNVDVLLVYSLRQIVYVAELRSSPMVHPTLRTVAIAMGKHLQSSLPAMALYVNEEVDPWDIRRGEQDIIKR